MAQNKIFAIGDVHGCAEELALLLKQIPVEKNDTVIFLGDYVDRGPYSKESIDLILEYKKTHNVIALMGNHEKMFLDFLKNKDTLDAANFIFNGGGSTLASYSNDTGVYNIPESHMQFLESLKLFWEENGLFFVHAGVPDIALKKIKDNPETYAEDLLWIRDSFHHSKFKWDKLIVHAHTPGDEVYRDKKRINLDTGAAGGGKITAMQFPDYKTYEVHKKEIGVRQYIFMQDGQRRSVRWMGNIPITFYKNEKPYSFNTINYSESGLFTMAIEVIPEDLFDIDEEIRGNIFVRQGVPYVFTAKIVRREIRAGNVFYAVTFLTPPQA